MMKFTKGPLITSEGKQVIADKPVIVSASRSTDIPAFYARWFFDRLKAGYVTWTNPFNGKVSYVSFEQTKVIVFWTKNPKPIIPLLPELDKRGIHYYFQYTLNDYDDEGFEPHVPKVESRVEIFKRLSEIIGPDRVIWRFDPLIITPGKSVRDLMLRVFELSKKLQGLTNKLVFSFIDIDPYKKVKTNLVRDTAVFNESNIDHSEFSHSQMLETAQMMSKMRVWWHNRGWDLTIATCAEQIDLSSYGIEHNHCVDAQLIKRVFCDDIELVHFLDYGSFHKSEDLLSSLDPAKPLTEQQLKDKGQRENCGCMVSKDIGMYNTCPHGCVYCYANSSQKRAIQNYQEARTHPDSTGILFKKV